MKKIPLPVSMLAVTFIMIWLAMCPAWNPLLVDGMLFHPESEIDTSKIQTIEGVKGKEIEFGSGSNKLSGWYYQVPESKFVVLFSHGNAGNLSHRKEKIARLLKCGQSVFIWDYPGFGHSKGLASLKTIAQEALSAYDFVEGLGYKPEQIVLYGESVGSGINAEISAKRKVAGVITDSGFTELNEIAKEKCPIFYLYPDSLLPPASMKVKESLADMPSLIIHSKEDETIPFHHALDLQKAAKHSTLLELSKSTHNSTDKKDSKKIDAALSEFFTELGN